jgi:imidazolonepropionase-like amidohydrolase
MRKWTAVLLLLASQVAGAATVAYTNGKWFDGTKFAARTMYVRDGVFVSKPAHVDQTIDLGGGWVVPPFGEAHNHNVEGAAAEQRSAQYLRDGIFYVENPTLMPNDVARQKVNKPETIDAIFATSCFTSTGGHPWDVVDRNIKRGGMTEAQGDGMFYFAVDSAADVERRWPAFVAFKPDIVKTVLVYSDQYAKRQNDPAKMGWRGLDPALLPLIVKKSHRAGLRVTTHVENAADFRAAVAAGVDQIAHLPGFRPELDDFSGYANGTFLLTDDDAARAARKAVVVVTTVGETINSGNAAARDVVKANLQMLRRHNVRLAIGSDAYRAGVIPEVMALHSLGIFTNAELLQLWGEATSTAIYPHRKLGRLANGYEASFVVLGGDPLADFENVRKITTAVKRGRALSR